MNDSPSTTREPGPCGRTVYVQLHEPCHAVLHHSSCRPCVTGTLPARGPGCGSGSAYGKDWERMIERNYQTLPRPHQIAVDPVGLFYTWWRGDLLPVTRSPAELVVEKLDMPDSRGVCTPVDADDAQQRYERGHRLWRALLGDVVAGWGWVAARE